MKQFAHDIGSALVMTGFVATATVWMVILG